MCCITTAIKKEQDASNLIQGHSKCSCHFASIRLTEYVERDVLSNEKCKYTLINNPQKLGSIMKVSTYKSHKSYVPTSSIDIMQHDRGQAQKLPSYAGPRSLTSKTGYFSRKAVKNVTRSLAISVTLVVRALGLST